MTDQPLFWSRRRWLQGLMALSAVIGVQAQDKPKMRVGFISRYQPYSFAQPDGAPTGFDVEVVRALLVSLGFELEPVMDTFVQLRQKLKAGDIAFIGNQLLLTPENRRHFDFVKSYATIQLVTVLHEDDDRDLMSLDDFLGKRLGVLANTGVEEQARGAVGKSVQSFERIEDALRALADKKLDAVLEENLIAEYFIDKAGLPLKVGVPFAAPIRVGLAVPKGQKDIEQKLSTGVQTLVKEPTFRAISTRWFGYDVSRPRVSHASNG
ncbi:transporter substrate-binding domain-containing protein [Limnohabitans sp. 15K]|uniref:ABC transporter substrate-binding protein n=1 Tax=Limnohabitans sp. 15K TaxID=1100706 RepID=UPI0013042238|nr:transporter substrate-binding domain-containing protein [Limnohabitans sp. 15K]